MDNTSNIWSNYTFNYCRHDRVVDSIDNLFIVSRDSEENRMDNSSTWMGVDNHKNSTIDDRDLIE